MLYAQVHLALPADWIGELEKRGITVRRDILRDYGKQGGRSY